MRKICFNCGRQLKKDNVCSFCGYKNTVFETEKNNELSISFIVWVTLSVIGILFSLCIAVLFSNNFTEITPLAFVIPAFTIPKLIGEKLKGWAPYVCQLIVIVTEIVLYCLINRWASNDWGMLIIYLMLYIFYMVILVNTIIVFAKFIVLLTNKKT